MSEVFLHFIGATQPATPSPSAVIDVVFVHGLNGDAIKTWAAGGDPENFWPRWLAEDVSALNIWSAEYDVKILASLSAGGGVSLIGRAASLLDVLLTHGIGKRPVIFVTHSLGGLLIKQILRSCYDSINVKSKRLLQATKAIVFCGTPHKGAKLATSLNNVFALVTSTQLKQLQENEEQLKDLHNWFINWIAASGATVKAYREGAKTGGIWVVPEDTANPGIPGCDIVPIDGDHIQMCKPTNHESPLYLGVRALAAQTIESSYTTTTGIIRIGAAAVPAVVTSSTALQSYVTVSPALFEEPNLSSNGSAMSANAALLPSEIAIDFEHFTTVAPHDRRTLSQKLSDAHRAIEIADAERSKERFAKSLYRHASQSASLSRYTRLMSEIETRFKLHVRPLIAAGKEETEINGAVTDHIIQPVLEQQRTETEDISAAVVMSALYYLTGNCHVRWDENET